MDTQKNIMLIVGFLVLGLLLGSFITGQATRTKISGDRGRCIDFDGDGFFSQKGCGSLLDCNDNYAKAYPGAVEICQNGLDENCNYIDEACTAAKR